VRPKHATPDQRIYLDVTVVFRDPRSLLHRCRRWRERPEEHQSRMSLSVYGDYGEEIVASRLSIYGITMMVVAGYAVSVPPVVAQASTESNIGRAQRHAC
jgi:hypothetical protein